MCPNTCIYDIWNYLIIAQYIWGYQIRVCNLFNLAPVDKWKPRCTVQQLSLLAGTMSDSPNKINSSNKSNKINSCSSGIGLSFIISMFLCMNSIFLSRFWNAANLFYRSFVAKTIITKHLIYFWMCYLYNICNILFRKTTTVFISSNVKFTLKQAI